MRAQRSEIKEDMHVPSVHCKRARMLETKPRTQNVAGLMENDRTCCAVIGLESWKHTLVMLVCLETIWRTGIQPNAYPLMGWKLSRTTGNQLSVEVFLLVANLCGCETRRRAGAGDVSPCWRLEFATCKQVMETLLRGGGFVNNVLFCMLEFE